MTPSPNAPIQAAPRLPFYRQLYVQVLVAIALGVLIGHLPTIVTSIAGMKELGAIARVAAKASPIS